MIEGDEWGIEGAHIPTREDMIKYARTRANVILAVDNWAAPQEVVVVRVINGGELFCCVAGWGHYWIPTSSVRVLAILPDESLKKRLKQLDNPPEPEPKKKKRK